MFVTTHSDAYQIWVLYRTLIYWIGFDVTLKIQRLKRINPDSPRVQIKCQHIYSSKIRLHTISQLNDFKAQKAVRSIRRKGKSEIA